MRVFIGSFAKIYHYERLKEAFSSLSLSWTREENLHLTYAFFSDHPHPHLILEALKELPLEHKELELKGMAYVSKGLLYAKVEDEALYKNYKLIRDSFGGEIQSFLPHVTLARTKACDPLLLQEQIKQNESLCLGTLSSEIVLVQSSLNPEGVSYKIFKED